MVDLMMAVQNLQQFAFWNLIIRPPRAKYTKDVLGPIDFTFDGGQGRRRDVEIQTKRGSHVACSHFVPVGRGMDRVPVVIYLHGNTSNRLEAWDLVVPFLRRGVSLFCYDAAGCGISEGEYISLGAHERYDLADIVGHLRKSPFCGPIALWGWSMGAVTSLLYADSDPSLAALCLESPFANLRQLVEDLAQQGTQIAITLPSWLIDPAIALVKMRVQDLADFDIDELVPLESAKKARIPAIFISRRGDTFVSDQHTKDLLKNYAGDCEHIELEGDHSCTRTSDDIKHVVDFFCRAFNCHAIAASLPSLVVENEQGSCSDELFIPEEHEQKHPTPRQIRPVTDYDPDSWCDRPISFEGARSKPRCLDAVGVDFPEPRPRSGHMVFALDRPWPSIADDLPLPPIAAEPPRAQPLGNHSRGSGVTAVPRQEAPIFQPMKQPA